MKKILIIIGIILIVAFAIVYFIYNSQSPREVYSTQEECEKVNPKCSFGMCENNCGAEGRWKGWVPVSTEIKVKCSTWIGQCEKGFYCKLIEENCEDCEGVCTITDKEDFITDCTANDECHKFNACEEMICAKRVSNNYNIAQDIVEDCKIDLTLYDPPNAFSECSCINNSCQFKK